MTSQTSLGCMLCAIGWLSGCSAAGGSAGGEQPVGAAGSGSIRGGSDGATPGNVITGDGSPGALGPPAAAGAGVPCDVAAIVRDHCITCHAATPQFNAPMSLLSAEDFGKPAPITSSEPVRSVAARRIRAEGAARMPPPGTLDALEPAELEALAAWLDAGAPSVANGCAIGAGDTALLPGGSAELLPRPTLPGTLLGAYEGWDADGVECYPFVTYQPGQGDKSTPYAVGAAVDQYIGFGFKPPWQGTRYVRAFRTIIDNAQVLHHWILFEEPSAEDGSVNEIIGAHPGGQMMHGWAPGGTDLYFTPDVGIRMDSSTGYLLEVHYNSSDPDALDASGLEICVTQAPPENEAIISWLGTDLINGTSATGTCRPRASEPIHIIAGTPHMHLKGRAMKVEVTRENGASEVVHDEAFSFQNQRGYAEDLTILPGDSITTTCSYSAPATFGKGTNEEMCYWFALAYPAGALSDGGFFGALAHGANACLGL